MYADGYKYWFAFKTDKTSYYRCCRYIRSKCPGKCTSEDGFIKQHNIHNHPPESNRILVDKFRKILTQRACAENTELYTIYCDEATNRHTDAALLYPFTSAESAMRKARRKQLPSCIPKTVDDIITELDNTDLFRVKSGNDRDPLHQKTITLENNAICMIFLHRKTINLFGRIDEIHIDGSFEFIIENQSNYYLLTVHAIQGQITAPILYAITTTKIKSSYIEIFKYIRDELKISPNIIISDYDILMQSSLKYIYPDTIIKGCWYHYTDAILMQVKNLNLKSELQRGNGASSLRMLLVLPLLPPEYMVPGIESIRKWMKEKLIFSDNLSILCNYIEYNWLKLFGTEKMSIFGTTRIASNHLKNFNRELSDLIGKQQNPIIWIILDSLTQLATKIYVKTTRKMRFLKHTINLQNNNNNNINNNDKLNNNYKQKTTSIKCAPTINSFDLTKQSQLILPIPRTMKRSELVSETIITSATQLWIKTPVHLRNSLQFLQLISHCINDSMYLANLSDIKERNYLPSIASIENLKLAIDSTKTTLNNNNNNNGNNSNNNNNINNNNNSNINSINSDQETPQNIIMQSFILEDENLGNNSSGSSCNNNNTQIIQMIENNHNNIVSTTNHWNNTNQLNDLQQQQSPSSPTLSFELQEGTFNCTEITHQEYLLAQPGQAQQQNTYTSCFAQNNFNIDDLTNHHHHDDQQHHHQNDIIEMNNLQQEKHQMLQNDCQQQQQSNNVFNFDDQQHHQHLHHHIDHNNINSVEIRPMLQQQQQSQQIQQQQQQQNQQQQQSNLPPAQIQQTEPPPLVFFKSVKRYPLKRILPVLSEPPPLVPINSAKRSLLNNKSSNQK